MFVSNTRLPENVAKDASTRPWRGLSASACEKELLRPGSSDKPSASTQRELCFDTGAYVMINGQVKLLHLGGTLSRDVKDNV